MQLSLNVYLHEISRPSLNLGYAGQKLGHKVKSEKNLVYIIEVSFSIESL